jgi:predicted nucleic-acid-binding protein
VIAVDTNVLVRMVVDEPSQPAQVRAARRLAAGAGAVHVPLVVLVEMVWVLESAYQVDKPRVLSVLEHLLSNDAYQLEAQTRCVDAVNLFAGNSADFSDCLILAGCRSLGMPLHSFDKRMARLQGAARVEIAPADR